MKISAYFFDSYTNESIWIAAAVWPLYFLAFHLFYKTNNLFVPLIASLIMASFSCLIFADSLIEYLTFFLGVGLLVFGSMAMMNLTKESLCNWIIGVVITCLVGLIIYLLRTKIYKITSIPNTKGKIDTLISPGGIIWITIQLALYCYVAYLMLK